jgi:hypothetical protein
METKIKKTFLDSGDNIYVVDNNDILYFYDGIQFCPFAALLKDIKQCFCINNRFFVHNSNTLVIFNDSFHIIEPSENWITKNIDLVCYNAEKNVIVTLEHGEVWVNYNITQSFNVTQNFNYLDEEIERTSLSHIIKRLNNQYLVTEYHQFDDIKIVDDVLLAHENNVAKIFSLGNIHHLMNIKIDKDLFKEIIDFNDNCGIFTFRNGSAFLLDGTICNQNLEISGINNIYFYKQKKFFLMNDNNLICFYNKDYYQNIIEPLINLVSATEYITVDITEYYTVTNITLPKNTMVLIINGGASQIIIIDDKPFLLYEELKELVLDDELLYFNTVSILDVEKTDDKLPIDIQNGCSIIKQLIHIIPYIYRLNKEKEFEFHQTDINRNVISYGEGVTRQIFNNLRQEIDDILQNKFGSFDSTTVYDLGLLFYFCNREGLETFFNIHPYFFYLLAKKSDYVMLLKKFKGDNFQLYFDQYKNYLANPDALRELELDISSANDYIKFLMSSDLNPEQQLLYESFVRGFIHYASRNKYFNFFKTLPIIYYIDKLVANGYFNATLIFYVKDDSVDKKTFNTFCKTFKNIFNTLTKKEKALFTQNVTGSQYYNSTINIILAYNPKELPDENVIPSTTIPADITINLHADPNAVIDADIDTIDKRLSYEISTCNTELTINIEPTEKNIIEIVKLLTIEDQSMKN